MAKAKAIFLLFLTFVGLNLHANSDSVDDTDLSSEIEREIENAERAAPRARPRSRTLIRRSIVASQPSAESFVRLAPVAGYSYSEWDKASPSGGRMDSVGGFVGGIAAVIGQDRFNYEIGLQYAERGSVYKGALKNAYGNFVSTDGASIETTTKYLEIPAFVRFNFVQMREAQLFVRGGGSFAMLVGNESAISRGSSNAISYNGVADVNVVSREKTLGVDLSSTDWRWAVGLGGNLRISSSISWTVDGLFERSLVEIGKAGEEEAYVSGFVVRTGVIFDL